MATFPKLATGAVTQYPSGRRLSYATSVTRFVDGGEQRFREAKAPVRRWLIRLHNISADESAAIETFFRSMQGQFASFSFEDPWDGVVYPDCSIDQERLSAVLQSESAIDTYLLIRNNTL